MISSETVPQLNQMESVGEIYLQLYRNLMCKHRLGFEVNRLVFRVGKDHL